MALFSKKINIFGSIRIGQPGRSLSQNLKFLMNYFPNAQVVSIPFAKRIWVVSVSAQIVAIPSVFLLKNAWR